MKFLRRYSFALVASMLLGIAGILAIMGPARVQNAGQTLSTLLPADLIQVYRAGTAAITYATPAQVTSQSGYFKGIPSTGFSYTFGNSQSFMALAPTGTISAGTIVLAPAPSDGARECFFTTNTITSLTVSASAGQSINNAVTTLTANTGACYLYGLSNTTWDRM